MNNCKYYTDEGLLDEYERTMISYGERVAKGENIEDDMRKKLGALGAELHKRLTFVRAEETEAVARALFNLAVEERAAFFAFHQETVTREFKFEGLMRERFIKQATTALTATGKTVSIPAAGA